MNKQTQKTIDWASATWNIVSGCEHNCHYCYAKRMANRLAGRYGYPKDEPFRPTFHRNKLHEPINWKKPQRIFVSSMGDLWGDWVDSEWIDDVLDVCVTLAPWHTYLFLTKNPKRYGDFRAIENGWYGTTVDGTERTEKNIRDLVYYTQVGMAGRFVSFEPLLAPVEPDLFGIQWIIIGANSNKGAEKPPDEWADRLIELAREENIAIWVKNNFKYKKRIKEFPKDGEK